MAQDEKMLVTGAMAQAGIKELRRQATVDVGYFDEPMMRNIIQAAISAAPAQPDAVEGAEYAPITVRSYSVARTTPADDALRVAVEALEKIEDLPAAGTPEHIAAAIASEALAEIAALKAGGVK